MIITDLNSDVWSKQIAHIRQEDLVDLFQKRIQEKIKIEYCDSIPRPKIENTFDEWKQPETEKKAWPQEEVHEEIQSTGILTMSRKN